MREASRPRVEVERPRCPFCHDAVTPEDEKHGCRSCMAWHHEECWGEALGRCGACGRGEPGEVEASASEDDEASDGPTSAARGPSLASRYRTPSGRGETPSLWHQVLLGPGPLMWMQIPFGLLWGSCLAFLAMAVAAELFEKVPRADEGQPSAVLNPAIFGIIGITAFFVGVRIARRLIR